MNKCIYKETEDLRFRKAEHVIPAGLGGKTTLPKGYVSDKMNEMFSAIEAKALRTTIIGGVRNFVGPGHRGKMTVSKKLKPHMNILKLNDEFSTGVASVFKYKMGFMLDRKTKFIPQILFKISQNLEIEQVIYSSGEFNNDYNSLNKFVVAVNNINCKKVIPIQAEHDVEFSGIILGNFYGEWYMYSNVPFITIENLIKIIREQKWSEKIQINLSSGGKYDFSYKLSKNDEIQVRKELIAKEIEVAGIEDILDSWIDCQKTFGEKLNSKRLFRLSEALVAADILYEDGAHDGLVDAYNTALLFAKMEREKVLRLNPYYRNILLGTEEEERCCSTLGSLFRGIDMSAFAVA